MSKPVNVIRPLIFLLFTTIALLSARENISLEGNDFPAIRSTETRAEWSTSQHFDSNEWMLTACNDGTWITNQVLVMAGGRWPRATAWSAVYASGLWIGATVNSEVRLSAAQWSSEFAPGPILSPGVAADPWDSAYRLYKLNHWDEAGNADYDDWPSDLGAPVDENGKPELPLDQSLFLVYNDLNNDFIFPGGPLGAEVRQTIFGGALSGDDPLNRTVFTTYQIINRSSTEWTDAWFSLWADPDLDGYFNDHIGYDKELNLAYCYNSAAGDDNYAIPPALGFQLLSSNVTTHWDASVRICSETDVYDPGSAEDAYHLQQGLQPNGLPITDPVSGLDTTFMAGGDPVTGGGWIDTIEADKRLLMSFYAGTVAAGDTVEFTLAMTISTGSDNLNSITQLKADVAAIKTAWEGSFSGYTPTDRPILTAEFIQLDPQMPAVEPAGTVEGWLELKNSGNALLTGDLTFDGTVGYSADPASFTIPGGSSQTIRIEFTAPAIEPQLLQVPNDFATIQGAIDNCQPGLLTDSLNIISNDALAGQDNNKNVTTWLIFPGDEILVSTGQYDENLSISGRTVHLHSSDGPEATIINGDGIGNCLIIEDSPGSSIAGFTLQNGSGNTGGGIYCYSENVVITNNIIKDNIATSIGGGIYARGSGWIDHNVITGNSAISGGGVRLSTNGFDLVNNTLAENSSDDGTDLFAYGPYHRIINNILWSTGNNLLVATPGGMPEIEFNIIQDNWVGNSNFSEDPLFVDAAHGDYTLQSGSPAIDAGHPDLNGNGIPYSNDPEDQDPDHTRLDIGAFYLSSGKPTVNPAGFTAALHRTELIDGLSFELENWGDGGLDYELELVSPDSTWLVYKEEPESGNFSGNIWKMRADGSDKTQLTAELLDRDPVWSPDGSQIAFWSYRSGNADIWLMDADGTNLTQLTTDPAYDYEPSWHPSGDYLIIVSSRDNVYTDLYKLYLNGTIERLTNNELKNRTPKYAPDGSQIAVSANLPGGDRDIYIYTADGATYWNISSSDNQDYQPDWSPTGNRVVWASRDFLGSTDLVSNTPAGNDWRSEYPCQTSALYPRYSPDGQYLSFAMSVYTATSGDELFLWHRPFQRQIPVSDNTPLVGEWGIEWSPCGATPTWIGIDHSSGHLEAGNCNTVNVSLNLGSLPPGFHNASVLVRPAGNNVPVAIFPLSFRISDTYAPVITAINDMPNDQGGIVTVRFLSSLHDTDRPQRSTEFYSLWRRLPTNEWEGLTSVGAVGSMDNNILGATLQIATLDNLAFTEFRITAHMDEGTYASESAWGFSWDNLAPPILENISAVNSGGQIDLAWDASSAPDLAEYRIYRGDDNDFEPAENNLVGTTTTNYFGEHLGTAVGQAAYRITAMDIHDNESPPSGVVTVALQTDIDQTLPTEYALRCNYPNPFNPVTSIRYELPRTSTVVLVIYDLQGRQVQTLVDQVQEAGYRSTLWNGTNGFGEAVSAGVYFYRLQAGNFVQTKKMILLK